MDNTTTISLRDLRVGYPSKDVLSNLDLDLLSGELTCLLGPNGSGKSTLIRSMTAVQKPLSGEVKLKTQSINEFHPKELAKELSLVLTNNQSPGNLTVFALVALGRFPYTSWLGTLSANDRELINNSLEMTGMADKANRHFGELSDGEKQKVMIARALAQETDILILDEPTAHLDTPNRIEIFHLLKELTRNANKTILVSVHDLETAMIYADRLWLIDSDKIHEGIPEDLVLTGHLERSFMTETVHFNYENGSFERSSDKKGKTLSLTGDPILCFWIRHALGRNGYSVVEQGEIEIIAEGNREVPEMRIIGTSESYNTLEKLLLKLQNEED